MRREVLAELGGDRRTVFGKAARVDFDGAALDADAVKELAEHGDDLDVLPGAVGADRLAANLMELAAPPGGGALAAEHRPEVEHAGLLALFQPLVRDGPDDAGRALGAQRQTAPAAILERVHLLLHHVRLGAQIAHEDVGALEDGSADLAEAVAVEDVARRVLELNPV